MNEYRLYNLFLSKIFKFDKSDEKNFIKAFCETHFVTPKEFHEIFEVHITDCYRVLKNSVDTLTNKKIIVKSSIGDVHMPICSMALYNEKEHRLEIVLSYQIIPYVDVSTKYVKTRLYLIAKFKSIYSIRLYELITSFRSLGKCRLSIEKLKIILGVGEDKLKAYKDFKQRTLTPAINEVNKVCNFDINSIEIKTGRKVTEIGLKFKTN